MKRLQSKIYKLGTFEIDKISLSWFDDKRYALDNEIYTLSYFHKNIVKKIVIILFLLIIFNDYWLLLVIINLYWLYYYWLILVIINDYWLLLIIINFYWWLLVFINDYYWWLSKRL